MTEYTISAAGARELISSDAYSFLRDDRKIAGGIDSLFLGGSHAYGLAREGSDVDIRGFAARSAEDILLSRDWETVVDTATDTTIYSLDKFIILLAQANPNIVEFLGLRDDARIEIGQVGREILRNSDAFLSKRVGKTFGGYAMAQLNRLENAIGRNRSTTEAKVALERRSVEKALETFADQWEACADGSARVSLAGDDGLELIDARSFADAMIEREATLDDVKIDASFADVSMQDVSEMLACLVSVAKSYKNLTQRNRKKDAAHLSKHMSHLLRLYHMGTEILSGEGVITNRADAGDAVLLMQIKDGKYTLDGGTAIDPEFFAIVEEATARFDEARASSKLPEDADRDRISRILLQANADTVDQFLPHG
jgi:hypothetical protein